MWKQPYRVLATAISASTGFEYIVNIDLYDATTGRFFLRVLSEQRYTGGTLGQIWGAGLNPDRPDPWNVEVMTTLQTRAQTRHAERSGLSRTREEVLRSEPPEVYGGFPSTVSGRVPGDDGLRLFQAPHLPSGGGQLTPGLCRPGGHGLKALQMHKEVQRYAQELKRSADQYIATTNLTGDVICRMDKRGMWTFLNDAACQFYRKAERGAPRHRLQSLPRIPTMWSRLPRPSGR